MLLYEYVIMWLVWYCININILLLYDDYVINMILLC